MPKMPVVSRYFVAYLASFVATSVSEWNRDRNDAPGNRQSTLILANPKFALLLGQNFDPDLTEGRGGRREHFVSSVPLVA